MTMTYITPILLLGWTAFFYAVLYIFHLYVPKGKITAQILFLYLWLLIPDLGFDYIFGARYEQLPYFWFTASLILLFQLYREPPPKYE
ncbi:hypothetical protein [Alkalicoccus chagannorensis]|uniref:hypothetical protein n=1 Tax=Alkalicoccus chagannorensis TaxID=427072 RepID=UPI0004172FE7|nr:hypothetical protein [Alkalicoccus chagannorensis]